MCANRYSFVSFYPMERNHREAARRIFLTGFMGSGKSTIGPILANTLGYEYFDVDKLIEQQAGKRVLEIFGEEGEQLFRKRERDALAIVCSRDRCVVSLGGGTIANEENLRLIREHGVLVYIALSAEEILLRVQHRTDRPLLKNADGKNLPPREMDRRVRELLSLRAPFYERADVVVPADRQRVGITVDEIVKRLRPFVHA